MHTYEEVKNCSSWLKDIVISLYRKGYPKRNIAGLLGLNDPRIEQWIEEYEQKKSQEKND